MSWRSFMDYVLMVELGQQDAIMRNYDLDNLNGSLPGKVLDRSFARMGFDQAHTPRSFVIPEISARLRSMGYMPPEADVLAQQCRRWYNWDRIRTGELRQWPLKAGDNLLLD